MTPQQTDDAIQNVLRDLGVASAIDVTHELIERGQSDNVYAIGAVDCIRYALRRLVRGGKVTIAGSRACRLPARQVLYMLPPSDGVAS